MTVGTSEHGKDIHSSQFQLPAFKHILLVFGGLAGLEEAIKSDETLTISKPEDLFDFYINVAVGQGARTIRTEEAIPIALASLHRHLRDNVPPTTTTTTTTTSATTATTSSTSSGSGSE